VAQHLTNTVFIDRALIVLPFNEQKIPDEATALSISSSSGFGGGSNSGVVSQVVAGVGGVQVITTIDPRLTALGLPQYPPLPASMDPSKIEEIRRTVYVGNIDSSVR
jgi:probable splicing factor, arginine/serine-rich 7